MNLRNTAGNPAIRGRVLGGYLSRLILTCTVLTGPLYSQGLKGGPSADSSVRRVKACDFDFLPCNSCPSLHKKDRAESSNVSSSPFSLLQGDRAKGCQSLWNLDLTGDSPVAAESSLVTGTLRRLRLGDISQQSPNQQGAPGAGQTKEEKNDNPATNGSPGHIFWVVPAFKVDYAKRFKPLTPREKFGEWAESAYDPLGLSLGVFEAATLEHSSKDGFCSYGKGWGGFGKCYASLEVDSDVSSFIGDYALTVLLHQDPRYFRLGEGSFGKRLWYSVSRVFVTYTDSGRTTFYTSALAGTVIAGGLSNLYAAQQDRGFGHTLSRIGIDLGNTALYNASAEFWPDIKHKLYSIF
jgi:hypothetical protein